MKVPAGGGNRSGMLKNAVAGVGNEEGRRRRKRGGRKTAKLNRNQTPYQDQD